ncbi:unnamed protein product [Ceratitis capitata]|uniref:(Mediterranean fruit fly) hypothetical protein n=1 Tax=Ceratitis capitata TaxID=7213 RepID=A0A811UAK1_CERCA|nr:unnamed protein product [Ceratitis capitata]
MYVGMSIPTNMSLLRPEWAIMFGIKIWCAPFSDAGWRLLMCRKQATTRMSLASALSWRVEYQFLIFSPPLTQRGAAGRHFQCSL